jgi:endonuclease/exonuclease/phosphatase family metal-dependent hydrolase
MSGENAVVFCDQKKRTCMKPFIALAVLLAAASNALGEEDVAIDVMSFNIRYDNPADGPDAWPHRKDWVAEIIREQADVVGMQEVKKNQLDELKTLLPGYEFYGVGRDDGNEAGEYVPLAWKKDRFEAVEKGVFWLSETPDKPSNGWDADLNRVSTWARLKDKQSGKQILVLNTHFDHRGEQARRESAKLIREWVSQNAKGDPVIVTGDFNTTANSVPYKNLTIDADEMTLRDSRVLATTPEGPESTWNGFKEVVPGRRIDFIFSTAPAEVLGYRTLDETREGRFPSDHLPIVARLKVGS